MLEVTITGDRAVASAFARYSRMVADLADPLEETAREGERAALAVTPVLSGALAADFVTRANQSEASLTVGEGVEYAGVQNYGWPARGIEGSHFLEAGEAAMDQIVGREVEDELERAARLAGVK